MPVHLIRPPIKPQPGPQEAFLASEADIAIFGGAAGGGKTFALGLEGLRHAIDTAGFVGVFLRRERVQITKSGGLLAACSRLWLPSGASLNGTSLEFRWPGGGVIQLAHVASDKTVGTFDGTEIALLGFDEVQHFTEYQFFYLLSRVRSTCGVPPYVRATCNPSADSWLATFLAYWIDDEGYPIPERMGNLRWFLRKNDVSYWADTREELVAQHPDANPMSVTFIGAKLSDNRVLVDADPSYLAKLEALPRVERARLLGGNWKVRAVAGDYFPPGCFKIIDAMPLARVAKVVRHWDLAATVPSEVNPDPDYTAGVKVARLTDGRFVIIDVVRGRWRAAQVAEIMHSTAVADTRAVKISLAEDPGQAGKAQVEQFVRMFAGYHVQAERETGDKETRATPFAAQCQAGNVDLLRGPWNEAFLRELESFPAKDVHDDQVDAAANAFNRLCTGSRLTEFFA